MRIRRHFASATTAAACSGFVWAALLLNRAFSPLFRVEPIDTRDRVPDRFRTGPTIEELMRALDGHLLDIEIDPLSRPKTALSPGRTWRRANFLSGLPPVKKHF